MRVVFLSKASKYKLATRWRTEPEVYGKSTKVAKSRMKIICYNSLCQEMEALRWREKN